MNLIKPLGNLYFHNKNNYIIDKNLCLGEYFNKLNDEFILYNIIIYLDVIKDINKSLCLVNKLFYIYCNYEPLYKYLLELHNNNKLSIFHINMKYTYILNHLIKINNKNFLNKLTNINNNNLTLNNNIKNLYYSDILYKTIYYANIKIKKFWLKENNKIDIISNIKNFTVNDFINNYEKKNKPLIIKNLLNDYNINNLDELLELKNDEYYRVGHFDMKFKEFMKYLNESPYEELPLYLFDSKALKKRKNFKNRLKIDLKYFNRDLFGLLNEDKRPDFQWIIIGGTNSCSKFHLDPNCTHAWNLTVKGKKKWILLPPDQVPPGKLYLYILF